MDMKRVEAIAASWITEWENNFKEFTEDLLEYEDIDDIKYLIQTIKQQQEALDGVGKLNEYLQTRPDETQGRLGESVALIAIDVIEQQHTLIERYEEALEFYAERNHYRVLEFYDHNEILDHGEIARQALGGGGG